MSKPLGRRKPPNLEHVARYPLSALVADPTHELAIPPPGTEKSLGLPWWWKQHNQGVEGSCVGFGCSSMMSVTNHYQRLKATGANVTYRYAARWLYGEAQSVDEWPETPPEEGTSVRAGCQILHERGHRRVQNGVTGAETPAHGISAYRWATDTDEVRAAVYGGLAVAIGVDWYSNFDEPVIFNGERWIGRGALGQIRGGHCLTIYRMSDRRQAFCLINSWGAAYAPVWLPYDVLTLLIDQWGEVAVVVDR